MEPLAEDMHYPALRIGDVIRHATTREEGRVVRIVNVADLFPRAKNSLDHGGWAYIVCLDGNSSAFVFEALWFQTDIEPSPDSVSPPISSGLKPPKCWICGESVSADDQAPDSLESPAHRLCHDSPHVRIGTSDLENSPNPQRKRSRASADMQRNRTNGATASHPQRSRNET